MAADCSARNWAYHPCFVLYNNLDQGTGLKTWLRPWNEDRVTLYAVNQRCWVTRDVVTLTNVPCTLPQRVWEAKRFKALLERPRSRLTDPLLFIYSFQSGLLSVPSQRRPLDTIACRPRPDHAQPTADNAPTSVTDNLVVLIVV